MAGPDKHSKTEAPTAKRKKEARKDGQVVRSEDLVTWFSLLVATLVLPGMVSRSTDAVTQTMRAVVDMASNPDERQLTGMFGAAFTGFLGAVLPAMLALMGIAILGNLAQVGFLLSSKAMRPKFSRLNPLEGFKRIFSVQSLWSTATSMMKLAIIVAVAWIMVNGAAAELTSAPFRSATDAIASTAGLTLAVVRGVAAAALLVGIADYAFNRRKQARDLRMTKHEVKQEHRESDGDPHVKGRQRQLRSQMSRNRMLASVPQADVVITNPTHYAIAIEYQRSLGAPKVIARGSDALAARIRAEATAAGVPLVEAKPLARTLYAMCRVGEEIPPELYQGVAHVLAFLQHVSATRTSYGGAIGVDVPDTWTPTDGELVRVPPARRRALERAAALEAAANEPSAADPSATQPLNSAA